MQASQVPASLRQWAHLIAEIEDYRSQGKDGDGYWCHLVPGWVDAWTEVHSVHEDNITECAKRFRQSVKKCDCHDCRALLGKPQS